MRYNDRVSSQTPLVKRVIFCTGILAFVNGICILWFFDEYSSFRIMLTLWFAVGLGVWLFVQSRVPSSGTPVKSKISIPYFEKRILTLLGLMVVVISSLMMSAYTSSLEMSPPSSLSLSESPPLIHDEYSYLLQAKMILGGRWTYPSHAKFPQLFNSMHVINNGSVASRYFPGTGLWLAPFVWVGYPIIGMWVSSAIVAALAFLVSRLLTNGSGGFIAGMFTALSPGMSIFSNLLLSSTPTAMGLAIGLYGTLCWIQKRKFHWLFISGGGFAFAGLCRPLTATSWLVVIIPCLIFDFVQKNQRSRQQPTKIILMVCSFGIPMVVAGIIQLSQNYAVTGSYGGLPYVAYQEHYTPNHRYGFDNVVRGNQIIAPNRLNAYDSWAENLTLPLALRNAKVRLISSLYYTGAFLPLVLAGTFAVGFLLTGLRSICLLLGLIFITHAAYFPYWFSGVFGWHYVFESLFLWLILLDVIVIYTCRFASLSRTTWLPAWWCFFLVNSFFLCSFNSDKTCPTNKALGILYFSAHRYEQFHLLINSSLVHLPAIVLVKTTPSDLHQEYIVNDPDLKGDILFIRDAKQAVSISDIQKQWPERWVYIADLRTWKMKEVTEPSK